MTRRTATAVTAALLALAAPAPAQAQQPADVTRVEAAVVELAKLKRGSEGQVSAHERSGVSALNTCRSKGAGWARIRKG